MTNKDSVIFKVNEGMSSQRIQSYATPTSFGKKAYDLFDGRIDSLANTEDQLQTFSLEYDGKVFYTISDWFDYLK